MRLRTIFILAVGLLLMSGSNRAQDAPQPSEYQVKAAFIFNFAKFVEWPPASFADGKAPLCIGVMGENPFGSDLEHVLRDKRLNSRLLTIRECRTVEEAKTCQVLFITASEKSRLKEILDGLSETHILTVGETETFVKSGGMINFVREGNRFRFEINDKAARKAGLRIASKLLELGKKPTT
ncbi:MAG TPA: YfiR family protein [Candidatus Limnocylindria bacterium]|nr:YfiR family protein [Candidatus Limnocylindria bacterium]